MKEEGPPGDTDVVLRPSLAGGDGQVFIVRSVGRDTLARMDDRAQLQAWRGGDSEAGQALVERHYASVLRFFRTKGGEDADDLVQQTFLRAFEQGARFRGDSSFRSFLFGIARNVLFEHIRRKVRDGRVSPDFGVSSILDLDPRASTLLFRRAEERALVQALQRMPIEIQIVVELYYWEELPVNEVAAAVEVPPGTIKSRLHRGRELLRQAMEKAPAAVRGAEAEDGQPSLARWVSLENPEDDPESS